MLGRYKTREYRRLDLTIKLITYILFEVITNEYRYMIGNISNSIIPYQK